MTLIDTMWQSSVVRYHRVAHQMTLIHNHEITTASESEDFFLKEALHDTIEFTNYSDGAEL